MFRPNLFCTLFLSSGATDVYGQPLPSVRTRERCAIVSLNLKSEKSSVRADSSASRGAARELAVDALLLLTKATKANIDDVIEVAGAKLRIRSKFPRHDLNGQLDHFEVGCDYWSKP